MRRNTTIRSLAQKIREAISQKLFVLGQRLALVGSTLSLSLGSVFFIPHHWSGAILWIALLQNPRYAVFAALGSAVGGGIEKVLSFRDTLPLGGGLKANALLAAVMVAWLTGPSEIFLSAQLVIAIAAAAAAAILAATMINGLRGSNLPSLIWGYCIIAALLFSICPTCTVLATNTMQEMVMPEDALGWGATFIRSLGSLIYIPNSVAGFLVGLAILLWSRIMFVTGLIGWVSGVFVALAFEQLHIDYNWIPTSYNYFIVGMALGSIFFLPGWSSLLVAATGGAIAAFLGLALQHILQGSPITYLPITAAATIWLVIITISLAGSSTIVWRNRTPYLRPEEAWWHAAFWAQKFGHKEVLFSLPVAGELHISQGFNGSLSHAGNWCHALDFQRPITIENSLDPAFNIWGVPVFAPASGIIVRINNIIPDNQLGVCNYAENWGNYVVIQLDQGKWALLAHLQQNSILHTTGVRVEAGDYLGKVGNSGRSPLPHLHLQAQNSPEPGATTTAFRLVNYQSTTHTSLPFYHWNAAALPSEEDNIILAYPNQRTHALLASIAPGSAVWSIEAQGDIPPIFQQAHPSNIIRINTTLDAAGQHLFNSSTKEGTLIAYLSANAWQVVETRQLSSPFMKLLALAAPTIPYSTKAGMTWQAPVPLMPTGPESWFSLSAAPYMSEQFISSNCKCISEPGLGGDTLQIETTLEFRKNSTLPLKLTCQFKILRGPVRIQADFEGGSVVYSLLSFEPAFSFDTPPSPNKKTQHPKGN